MFTRLQHHLPDVVDRLLVERENRAGKVGQMRIKLVIRQSLGLPPRTATCMLPVLPH